MGTIASQITSLTIVYSTVNSDANQRKHQSSASLAFVWGIHRGPVNSPHKWPVTRKIFPFDDVIMLTGSWSAFELTKDTAWHTDKSQNVKYECFRKQYRHIARIYCIPCFFSVPDSRFRKVFFKYLKKQNKWNGSHFTLARGCSPGLWLEGSISCGVCMHLFHQFRMHSCLVRCCRSGLLAFDAVVQMDILRFWRIFQYQKSLVLRYTYSTCDTMSYVKTNNAFFNNLYIYIYTADTHL